MSHAIQVRGISKRYRIAHERQRVGSKYRTLQESLLRAAGAPWRRLRQPGDGGEDGEGREGHRGG